MCDGFTVEGSTQGSWSDTNAGDTVTVTCQEDHVLEGNSVLTCTTDGNWSSDPPECVFTHNEDNADNIIGMLLIILEIKLV